MPYQSGLLSDFWNRYQQRKALTGRGFTSSEMSGLIEPMLAYDAQKAIAAGERERQQLNFNRQMSLQEQAQRDAASAAKASGLIQTGGLLGSGYLGYKNLQLAGQQAASQAAFNQQLLGLLGGGAGTGITSEGIANAASALSPASAYSALGPANAAQAAPLLEAPTTFGGGAAADALTTGAATTAPETAATIGAGTAGLLGAGAGLGVSKLLGANKDITEGLTLGGAGAGIGFAIGAGSAAGGPVGAVIGGVIGVGASLIDDVSVICSELLRQKRITKWERKLCIAFRHMHISPTMFNAYLKWAAPIVRLMRKEGIANRLLLPFTMRFVRYMVKTEKGIEPTFLEKLAWKYAWHRCSAIAQRSRKFGGKVAWVS